MVTVLHVIAFILIVSVVVLYNFVLPGSESEKIGNITAALAFITLVFSFALIIYDKVVGA